MTGPEHYREAEQMLGDMPGCPCPMTGCEHHRTHLAAAQVHATLALAAATADPFEATEAWAQALR